MTRRSGLSLVEVLTALFILALGVIAILTLFPLGASQMAVAVKEDRCAQAAFNADGYFRTYWKSQIVESNNPAAEPFFNALNNPGGGLTQLNGTENEPSYAVAVDPMGYVARTSAATGRDWIGDMNPGPQSGIPRRSLNAVTSPQYAQRICSLMDGLGYDENGAPTADRELRYNWLWIVQRPINQNRLSANLTVVVFDRRAHLYAPDPGSEFVFTGVTFTPGTTSVTVSGNPDIKPGAWVMDASVNVTLPTPRPAIRHAYFYRVTAVNGGTLELQSPLKTPSDGNSNAYTGTLVILRGVAGVYQRPMLTAGD